jgi:hypothetical protein
MVYLDWLASVGRAKPFGEFEWKKVRVFYRLLIRAATVANCDREVCKYKEEATDSQTKTCGRQKAKKLWSVREIWSIQTIPDYRER